MNRIITEQSAVMKHKLECFLSMYHNPIPYSLAQSAILIISPDRIGQSIQTFLLQLVQQSL